MDPDPDSYTDPDPDVYPDPVIFVSDLQDVSQKFYFFPSFLLITFEGTFTKFSKIKSHKDFTKQ